MTGINNLNSSAKEDILLTPKQRTQMQEKKNRIQFLFCLFLSNIMVFLIAQMLNQSPPQVKDLPLYKERSNYSRIKLPLKLYLPLNNETEVKATLFDNKGNVLIKKAYILPKEKESSTSSWSIGEGVDSYQLQIPEEDLKRLVKFKDQVIHAYPFHQSVQNKHVQSKPVRRTYEITF